MPLPAPEKSSRSRWARRAKVTGVALVGAYLALVAGVGLGYRRFLYPAKADRGGLEPRGLVRIERPGEPTVFGLHAPAPASTAPTLVVFHGNGEDLVDEVNTVDAFSRLGVGVFVVEYPGYGLARDQRVDEVSIYRAAAIAMEHLDELGVDRARRVALGFSLGSGVAVEMASRGLVSRVVLLAPYTSIPRVIARFVPVVPVDWLVGDRFDSLSKAPRVDVPALVVHGDLDGIIPVRMGEQLARALPSVTLRVVRGAHHNDLYAVAPDLRAAIVAFAMRDDTR